MNGPTTWAIGEEFTRDGVAYRLHTRTDTFGIATRVGAERDSRHEVKHIDDIIKVDRG